MEVISLVFGCEKREVLWVWGWGLCQCTLKLCHVPSLKCICFVYIFENVLYVCVGLGGGVLNFMLL